MLSSTENDNPAQSADVVTDPAQCEKYFDPDDSNFMENGYSMTRFLVGLSQSQSCFADFIMNVVVTMGKGWINQGLINLPYDANDPDGASHVQIEQTANQVQVWLYFAASDQALPTDLSNTQILYLSWTGNDDNIQGNYYMINIPVNSLDLDAPSGVRVDFNRTATTANNTIFLKLRPGHSAGMGGFRIDVSQDGKNTNATYTAKGLITFTSQPFNNVPTGAELPNFAATAIVDSNGYGASIANFNKFSLHLDADTNNDGTIDTSSPAYEFDLGGYQFTIADKTYFDPTRYDATVTATSYAEQVLEWRNKSAQNAIYIADHPREIPSPNLPISMLNCMESSTLCDYNADGVLDEDEWMGWGLGVGYFTNTCIDDASTASNNCTAFVDRMFTDSQFGGQTLNSTAAEPTDSRSIGLTAVTQLDSINPDSDPDGSSTFVITSAPLR